MLNGEADGAPPLHSGMRLAEWTAAFDDAYESLLDELDRARSRGRPVRRETAASSSAVCTEMFFERPKRFAREYPDVYAQLAASTARPAKRGTV